MPIGQGRGVIYLAWMVQGRRRTVCLHTREATEAGERARNVMGRLQWGDYGRYLQALARLGEEAAREMRRMAGGEEALETALGDVWAAYEGSRRRPQSGAEQMAQYRQQWERCRVWMEGHGVGETRGVSGELAERYAGELAEAVSASTARRHLQTLRRVWQVAGGGGANVWEGLRVAAGREEEAGDRGYRALSLAEARAGWRAVREECGEEFGDFVRVLYWTGLRRKDAALLHAGDFLGDEMVLRVPPPHKTRGRGRGPLFIPVAGELGAVLAGRCAGRAGDDWLFPAVAEAQEHGLPVLQKRVPEALRRGVERAGCAGSGGGLWRTGRVALHSLRATFITMMDVAGAPHRVTDRVTAHAPGSIRDRYSRPDIEAAREWIARAIAPLGEGDEKNEKMLRKGVDIL